MLSQPSGQAWNIRVRQPARKRSNHARIGAASDQFAQFAHRPPGTEGRIEGGSSDCSLILNPPRFLQSRWWRTTKPTRGHRDSREGHSSSNWLPDQWGVMTDNTVWSTWFHRPAVVRQYHDQRFKINLFQGSLAAYSIIDEFLNDRCPTSIEFQTSI